MQWQRPYWGTITTNVLTPRVADGERDEGIEGTTRCDENNIVCVRVVQN